MLLSRGHRVLTPIYQNGISKKGGALTLANVRFWHKANMLNALTNVRFWGAKRTWREWADMSANDPKQTFLLHSHKCEWAAIGPPTQAQT
jgi:hypothetical protein